MEIADFCVSATIHTLVEHGILTTTDQTDGNSRHCVLVVASPGQTDQQQKKQNTPTWVVAAILKSSKQGRLT